MAMPTRQSIHCVPEMATALRIVKTERSSQERSQTDVELKNRRDPFQDV